MKKLFAIILTFAMLFAMAPLSALNTAAATTASDSAGAISFTEVSVSSAADLRSYLQRSGNYKIKLIEDLSDRIGKKGDVTCDCPEYWCLAGSGVKSVDMNGYDFSLYCDSKNSTSRNRFGTTMFKIPAGAEFVLNDSRGGGTLNYNAMLKESYDSVDMRNIFTVNGGKLSVNSGRIIAGRRSDKRIIDLGYAYLQVNGHAIVLKSGEAIINGGRIEGRGEVYPTRCAAIYQSGGKLTINDGEICGYGNADALQIAGGDIAVHAGYFNVYKNDEEAYTYKNTVCNAAYGYAGIPGRAFSEDPQLERTTVWRNTRGEMSAVDVAGGGVKDVSNRVEVSPKNVTATAQYSFDGNSWYDITADTVINWDKQSNLKFRCFDSRYFAQIQSYDTATHYYPWYKAAVSLTPAGEPVSEELSLMRNKVSNDARTSYSYSYAETAFDLYDYKDGAAALENGKTYYLQLSAEEYFKGVKTYRRTVSPVNNIRIKITQPVPVPELDVDFDWMLRYDGNLVVTPKNDAVRSYLDNLRATGAIGSYKASIGYYNKNGVKNVYNFSDNTISFWGHSDIKRGASDITLAVAVYRGSVLQNTFTKTRTVIYPPEFTANKTVDSSNAIYFYPSATDRSVTFTAAADVASRVFWVKNGSKITGATGKTYSVSDAATQSGWYSLGYTYNGVDHYGLQEIYVGMKEGTRSVSVTKSSSTCTITSDTSVTPTFTVTTSGTGWSTIDRYRWEVVSVPEGMTGYARYHNFTTNRVTLAEIFSKTNYATDFIEGDYVLQCHVRDTLGNQQTGSPVTVTVKRPPTGLAIYCNGDDVTGKFIAFGTTHDTATLDVSLLPQNSVSDSTTYFSTSDSSVCTVTQGGVIQAKKEGTATITVTNGTVSKTVTVYVPKTDYDLTIPAGYLKAEPGKVAYQGAISVPSNAGFTAELKWCSKSAYGSYYNDMAEGDEFRGEMIYMPQVFIYPKNGVAYPVEKEYRREMWDFLYENINVTVNGETYYGAADGYYSYMTQEPLSEGDARYDYIYLYLDPTEKLVDLRDEYISLAEYDVNIPTPGQTPKALTDGNIMQLDVVSLTDGVGFGGDSLRVVTDESTIKDNSTSNDATAEFPEGGAFEAGKTYRYTVWLSIDSDYRTPAGGVARFTENASSYCSGMRSVTGAQYAQYGMLVSYIYFTVEEPDYVVGDVNEDGKINIRDVAAIQRYLANFGTLTLAQLMAADTDGDGSVTVDDATWLQMYLAEYDVVLGKQS